MDPSNVIHNKSLVLKTDRKELTPFYFNYQLYGVSEDKALLRFDIGNLLRIRCRGLRLKVWIFLSISDFLNYNTTIFLDMISIFLMLN